MPLDPSQPGTVLEYVGGRTKRYVPARDLEAVDVARIAYRRAADLERTRRPRSVRPGEQLPAPKRPGPAKPAEIEAVAEELVSSGAFRIPNRPIEVTQPRKPARRRRKPTEA